MMLVNWRNLAVAFWALAWVAPLVKAQPTDPPTTSPSAVPSMTPTEWKITLGDLSDALDAITDVTGPLSADDVMNQQLPFLGKSVNELIGGDAAKTVATLMDLSQYLNVSNTAVKLNTVELAADLTTYLNNLISTATGDSIQGCGTGGDVVEVTDEGNDIITIVFCAEFVLARSTTLDASGLFDNLDDVLDVDLDLGVDIDAGLLFSAEIQNLDLSSPTSYTIVFNPIEAELGLSTNIDITIGFGMLDLTSNAAANAYAKFDLVYCETDPCPSEGQLSEGGTLFLTRQANYSLAGDLSIGSNFPGLTLGGGADFSIVEDDVFDPSPVVEATGFNVSDFVTFSPENAIAMLRLIDSAIVRSQENEAFEINLPLTDTTVAKVLATGSVLTTSLLKLFQKPEPFADREPSKSLFISGNSDVATFLADSNNENATWLGITFEVYVFSGDEGQGIDLNVNPDNQVELRDLVNTSSTGEICTFTLSQDPIDSANLASLLKSAVTGCGITTCDASTCSLSDPEDSKSSLFDCDPVDCQLAFGTYDDDEGNTIPFMASVAYTDSEATVAQDIQLIGLMRTTDPLIGATQVFDFPVNQPAFPSLIPRFRNFLDFANNMSEAILDSVDVVDASVVFSYAEETNDDPAQYAVTAEFSKAADLDIALNASLGVGDLLDITVEDGSSVVVSTAVTFSTTFGVILAPDTTEEIVVLGDACGGEAGFNCTAKALEVNISYVENQEELIKAFTLAETTDLTTDLALALGDIATVNEVATSLYTIVFNSNISFVSLSVPKSCANAENQSIIEESIAMECNDDQAIINIENDYGLTDQTVSKRSWQIAVGETSIKANFTVTLDVRITSNVGNVIEITADLFGEISGDLTLALGTEDLLPFSDWLAGLTSIFDSTSEGFIENFFVATSYWDAYFNATVEPSSPFNLLGTATATGGFSDTFELDFLSNFSYPNITFDVEIDGIGDVRKLTFAEVVAILADALEWLVGSSDDDTVESCSGGLLGKEIGGVNVFTYQVPVLGISVCSVASFLQVLVEAVETLIDETSESSTTFSALDAKLTALLQDGVGGFPSVNITSTYENGTRSDLTVDIELYWNFSETESLNFDMASFFDEETISNNAGLEFFTNALLPGDASASIGIDGSLTFRLGVGLEYVAEPGPGDPIVNPYILGTTGFLAELSSDGQLFYEAEVGAFQGTVEADFAMPLSLSVGLDDSLNYYLADPGIVSQNREGFTNVSGISGLVGEIEVEFGGSATADVSVGLSLLGISLDVGVVLTDLDAFFRGNNSDSVFEVSFNLTTPTFSVPSLIDILLAEPQGIIDALSDVFATVEEATLGENGVITNFPVPYIRNSMGESLGAGTENNVLSRAERKIVPALQQGLDSFEGNTDTVAELLARLMELGMDKLTIRQEGEDVDVICYVYNFTGSEKQENVSCTDDDIDVTSIMWDLPFGQSFSIEIGLDFDLDGGDFPLEISFGGDDETVPTLVIAWCFNLAFGFDEDEGFFLFTYPDDIEELSVTALLSVLDRTIDATLIFLKCVITDLDLEVGAGVFIGLDKASALRIDAENATDPQRGRLSRTDFKKIVQLSDLFTIRATAAATVSLPDVSFQVNGNLFGENTAFSTIADWLPRLEAEVYVQARKEVSTGDDTAATSTTRRELRSAVPYLEKHPDIEEHPALDLFRSLDAVEEGGILSSGFNFTQCNLATGKTFCAKLINLTLNMQKIADLISPVLSEITNADKSGYLDDLVGPLIPLDDPLPGVSTILGRDISVLDVALIFIGDKSGAKTVKKIIEIYNALNELVSKFVDNAGLVIADECDILDGFKCTGGLIPDESRRTRSLGSGSQSLFDRKDSVGLSLTPAEHAFQYHRELACVTTFSTDDDCAFPTANGSCNECGTKDKIKCRANLLSCRGRSVEGLSFPFMSDLPGLVGLLSGSDIEILDFTPPEMTFAFEYGMSFVLYTPPTVEVGISFEFTARLKLGFVLDSKGIREAIEQIAPLKAFNSFALRDTFDGVDEAMITLTASVTLNVDVSAVIVKIGVSGSITFVVTVDLFDPYPETSGGLFRPFELLASGSSPLEWFEFGIEIFITISLYIKIGLFLGFVEITLFKYEVSFSFPLIDPILVQPGKPIPPVKLSEEGVLEVTVSTGTELECTSLGGSIGDEEVECILGDEIASYKNVKTLGSDSSAVSTSSPADVLVRNIQSAMDLAQITLGILTLDYQDTPFSTLVVEEKEALIGTAVVKFDAVSDSIAIKLPTPEIPLLTATIKDCNTPWDFQGHTRLDIKAYAIQSGCVITANGGDETDSVLKIDFGFGEDEPCVDGNSITLSASGSSVVARIIRASDAEDITLTVGARFKDIEIKGSQCEDEILVVNTLEDAGSVSISGGGGDDTIIIGTNSTGLDEIYADSLILDGGLDNDIVWINNFGSANEELLGELEVGSVNNLLNNVNRSLDYNGFEEVVISLSQGVNEFLVISTPPESTTYIYMQDMEDVLTINSTQGDLYAYGGAGNDKFFIYGGGDNVTIEIYGEADNDTMVVDGSEGNTALAVNTLDTGTIRWSGGDDKDLIRVVLTSAGTGETNVDLFDDLDGVNSLEIDCVDFACYLLSRENFIANIHNISDNSSSVERVNLDRAFNESEVFNYTNSVLISSVLIRLNQGENEMHFDDTMAPMDVYGGDGADSFYFGQLYNSARDSLANVAVDDPISTTTTTKGFLSDGNSHSVTVNGGFGNDFFDVLRNRFLLDLNGDSDDDTFIVRSFLILDLDDEGNATNTSLGELQLLGANGSDTFDFRGDFDNSTDDVGELPDYVVNSLVDIDGGTGNDRLVVVGTEADDSYVVTDGQVFGGGLTISYTNIEALEVTGEAGDDTITVLSTSPSLVTYIYGSLGSDTFIITPKNVDPVVSKNLRGHRGILEHTVSSSDLDYNELVVEGVAVDVLDNDGQLGAYINVVEEEAVHVITEDSADSFSFWVYPTVVPEPKLVLQVASQLDITGKAYLLFNNSADDVFELTFEGSMEPQLVVAKHNPASTPLSISDYNLLVKLDLVSAVTTDTRFIETEQTIRPIDVKLLPNADDSTAISVTVVEPDGHTMVAEGNQGFDTTYDIYLRPCTLKSNIEVTIEPTVSGQLDITPSTIGSTEWGSDCKVTVDVKPSVDSDEEGLHFVTLAHIVRDSAQNDVFLSDNSTLYADNVLVRIYDDEIPGVIIQETLDVTSTAEIDDDDFAAFPDESFYVDEYFIRLSKIPSENVTITVDSIPVASDRAAASLTDLGRDTSKRNQVLVGDKGSEAKSLSLVFTPDNWDVYQPVRVIADNDDIEEGVDYLNFPSQPSYLAYIQGPIFVSGDDSTNFPDVNDPVTLPEETDTNFFTLSEEDPAELAINSKQVDTLIIKNLDVLGNKPSVGTLYSNQFVGYNMAQDIVIGGIEVNDGITFEGMEVIEFELGGGVDSITVEETSSAIHYVDLADDDDELLIKNISGHFIVNGGNGNDKVTVSSDDDTLADISALLVFDGGTDADTLILVNSGDSEVDEVLNVTRNLVEVESMESRELPESSSLPLDGYLIRLEGASGGSFKLEITDPIGKFTRTSEFDHDIASADLESALQTVLFSGNEDTCGQNETSRCSQSVKVYPVGESHVIFFVGERLNEGVSLKLITDDLVDFEPEIFLNMSNDILGSISDIAYYDVELLDISMGSQDIVLNVRGTTAETFIKTQDSDDTVFISSDANEVISTAGSVDFLKGWLDYIEGDLHIEVFAGRHRLMMSDQSSNKSKGIGSGGPATLTENSLTQLSDDLGDIFFKATGGNWFDGVNLWLGQNSDSLNVLSIPSATSTDLQTSTSLHCGSGDDTVTISLDEASLEEVVFVANGQAGDDVIDASASSLPVILFGDDGNDSLTGGTGNDIIIGDFGRVVWRSSDNIFNPDGVIGAIAGGGGWGDFTDGVLRTVTDAYSDGTEQGGGDTIQGRGGNDYLIGGASDDTIDGEEGMDIIFGDSALIVFDLGTGFPESLTSKNCFDGGDDTLTGGRGDVDYLIGGTANDTISGNDGPDLVFGDHARITLYGDQSHKLLFATTIDAECSGGNDFIELGDGDDIAFGGAFSDTISGGEGQDIILGDFGEYDAETEFLDFQNYRSIIDFPAVAGGDTLSGGAGDDFILGQEGPDTIDGDDGNDDIYGGHQVVGGHDEGDTLRGGAGEDTVLGDNGQIVRQRLSITSDFPWVNGMEWLAYASPFETEIVRDVRRYDDIDFIGGPDFIFGGPGNDVLHGQRGDDYIEGNEGEDEIFGELGSDTLIGGNGNDIIIGDIGHAVRRYDATGSPLEQLDTSGTSSAVVWHKDIVLEEVGNITGVDRISTKIDTDAIEAEQVMSASLLFVANAIKSDGSKFAAAGGWVTDLIRFNLEPGHNDTLEGGDGDDVCIGQRGDDRIDGGSGADLLIGDAGFNTNPENLDMPRIHQVYRALRDESGSDYIVEGVSNLEFGVLFTADYTLYPHQYRENDNLASIVDMVVNADDIIAGKNLLKDVLGVGALSTTNDYCMQPMLRITPGYLYESQRMHGNDYIVSGDGESIIIGDDIRSFSGLDLSDVSYIQDLRRRIDRLENALGTRLNTMEVDAEFYGRERVGDYDISVASDTIETSISGKALVNADDLTIVSRTILGGSLVSGFFLFLRTGQISSIMDRFYDVERVMYDAHYAFYELHTQLLKNADATMLNDISSSQESQHSLVLSNDFVKSAGNGDIVAGDGSVMYFHVDRPGVGRFEFDSLRRLQRWRIRTRLRRSRRGKERDLRLHLINDLRPTQPLSGDQISGLPFVDVPFQLSTATDTIDMTVADNLATGDFAFFGIILSSRNEGDGALPSYTSSIRNLRQKLTLQSDVTNALTFNIEFYSQRYSSSVAAATAPKLHGDMFIGQSRNNAIFGEFMTGEAYTQYSAGEARSRVNGNANAFSVSSTSDYAGDTFDVVPGTQVNGQIGSQDGTDAVQGQTVLNTDLSPAVEKKMMSLFYGHRAVETMMENMFYGTNLDTGTAGGIQSGFQCTDPEFSSFIPPAVEGGIS